MRRTITAALAVAALFAAPVAAQDVFVLTDEFIRPLPVVGTLTTGECIKAKDGTTLEMGECGGGGGGDISGPVSSTDNAISRWDGTAGDTIQNSTVTIDDSGNMSLPAAADVTASTFEFVEDDTSRACAAGDFWVAADDSENKLKKCENGTLSDMGAVSGYVSAVVDDNDLVISDPTNTLRCDATMDCYEFDPSEVSVGVDTAGLPAASQGAMASNGGVTEQIDSNLEAVLNVDTADGGEITINGRPHIGNHPALRYWVDQYALNSGKKYVVWPTGLLISTVTSGAQERMAFPCADLRTIDLTFRNKDTGAPIVWPTSNTLTVGVNVEGTDSAALCTMISAGAESDYECDAIDSLNVWDRGELVAVWVSNSGASTSQIDVIVQIHCS